MRSFLPKRFFLIFHKKNPKGLLKVVKISHGTSAKKTTSQKSSISERSPKGVLIHKRPPKGLLYMKYILNVFYPKKTARRSAIPKIPPADCLLPICDCWEVFFPQKTYRRSSTHVRPLGGFNSIENSLKIF